MIYQEYYKISKTNLIGDKEKCENKIDLWRMDIYNIMKSILYITINGIDIIYIIVKMLSLLYFYYINQLKKKKNCLIKLMIIY